MLRGISHGSFTKNAQSLKKKYDKKTRSKLKYPKAILISQ